MSAQQKGTVLTTLKIDVSPDGVKLSIEGLETDLASLLVQAGSFSVLPLTYHTYDSSDVTIVSDKAIAFVDKPIIPST